MKLVAKPQNNSRKLTMRRKRSSPSSLKPKSTKKLFGKKTGDKLEVSSQGRRSTKPTRPKDSCIDLEALTYYPATDSVYDRERDYKQNALDEESEPHTEFASSHCAENAQGSEHTFWMRVEQLGDSASELIPVYLSAKRRPS